MKKTNNKGFSLVELIIVIAIMAVLIGVLAPQFIKYVEQSRASTDKQNVASIISAIQVHAVDPGVLAAEKLDATGTVTLTSTGATCVGNTDKALTAAGMDPTKIKLKSTNWAGPSVGTVVINVVVAADGTVTITANPATILE